MTNIYHHANLGYDVTGVYEEKKDWEIGFYERPMDVILPQLNKGFTIQSKNFDGSSTTTNITNLGMPAVMGFWSKEAPNTAG